VYLVRCDATWRGAPFIVDWPNQRNAGATHSGQYRMGEPWPSRER
jgi:hypothetical protein